MHCEEKLFHVLLSADAKFSEGREFGKFTSEGVESRGDEHLGPPDAVSQQGEETRGEDHGQAEHGEHRRDPEIENYKLPKMSILDHFKPVWSLKRSKKYFLISFRS